MSITTFTSGECKQGVSEAKRAADHGLVFITERDRPAYVMMTFEHYQQLTRKRRNIADALAPPRAADIAFEATRAAIDIGSADFP